MPVAESMAGIVREYLRTLVLRGVPVRYAVVFGSQASDVAHPSSDIDLLVVSPLLDGDHRREDVNLLWRVAAHTDSRIEPIAVGVRQFEEGDGSPIVEIAQREGTIVSLAR